MAIEKAFAIRAEPSDIYAALQRELAEAAQQNDDTFEVLRRERDRLIELRVTIAGIPCWLTYRIEPRAQHCEVSATLVPFGWKYAALKIVTLGRADHNFAISLFEGLANLKAEVEGDGADADPAEDAFSDDASNPQRSG